MPTTAELQQRFRDFADTARPRAPLYARLSAAIAGDDAVATLLTAAPPTQQIPVLLFAATHHLVLAGACPELAAHYPNLSPVPDAGDPWPAFRDLCHQHAAQLREIIATRHTQTNEVGRCATFLPAFAQIAEETGSPLAQVDVGTSAGLTLGWHRYGYSYAPGPQVATEAPLVLPCGVRGAAPLPTVIPAHGRGIGLDLHPIDVCDDDAVRWLEACVWPDQADRFHRLETAIRLAQSAPSELRAGDAVDDLAAAVADVAETGHPVVTTSWALSYLAVERQREFVQRLDRIGAGADISWVAAESPAQTPGLPIPHTPEIAELTVLSLTRWRGGRRTVQRLATAHPHG